MSERVLGRPLRDVPPSRPVPYELPETIDVGAPALLLTGTDGPSHLRKGVRAVHESLAESRLVEFEGLSHMGPSEDPGRVVAEVRAFLDGVAAPERTA